MLKPRPAAAPSLPQTHFPQRRRQLTAHCRIGERPWKVLSGHVGWYTLGGASGSQASPHVQQTGCSADCTARCLCVPGCLLTANCKLKDAALNVTAFCNLSANANKGYKHKTITTVPLSAPGKTRLACQLLLAGAPGCGMELAMQSRRPAQRAAISTTSSSSRSLLLNAVLVTNLRCGMLASGLHLRRETRGREGRKQGGHGGGRSMNG